MMYLRGVKRSTLLAAFLVTLVDVALVVTILSSLLGSSRSSSASGQSPVVTATPATAAVPIATTKYQPQRVQPPQTAVERAVNQRMKETSTAGLSLLARATCVAPATSAAFRSVGAEDSRSATMFALAFTQELLDIDFATATRDRFLAWTNYNNAPDSLSGLPASSREKVLCVSLTIGSSPVPSVGAWHLLAKSSTTWRVSQLAVSVSPAWIQVMTSGWTSSDPLMVIDDVSGLLTVTTPGRSTVVHSIAFGLTLGGASLHPGYGVVALNYWTVN